jgi:hypothetical protein
LIYLMIFSSLTFQLTHGADPFLRSHQLCSYSRTSQDFMQLEDPLLCLQKPSTGPFLSQINPIHTIPSYLSKIHFNIVHPPMPWASSGLLSSGFPTKSYMRSSYPFHATCPSHLILLDLIFLIIL